MHTETKADVEKAKAEQDELSHRIATRKHVPNAVPELVEVEDSPSSVKKLKVEKIFVNNTLLVKDGGKEFNVSIPINRAVRPSVGDTVEVRFTGEKDAQVATLVKPATKDEAKAAK